MGKKHGKKGGSKKLLIGLGAVALMGGVSLGLALLWQNAQEGINGERDSAEMLSAQNGITQLEEDHQPVIDVSPFAEQMEEPQEQETEQEQEQEEIEDLEQLLEEMEPTPPGTRPAPAPNAVPESARVDNGYFSDAIFFGDSLSTGIPLYQVAGNPDTVAYTGINPLNINTDAVINTPEGKKTILEAAKQYGEKNKVYIMLGANGLWMDENSFTNGYQTFLDGVKGQYPGAAIYVQSILPVTSTAYLTYETADNQVINRFNQLLQQLANKNGVHYLDVCQVMMDEEGKLPTDASPLDGMHLTPEYYNVWFEYLKTHTVEG